MARPRKFIRVIEHPDGSLTLTENGNGREVHGLSYNASNKSYYTVPIPGGKRKYIGQDLYQAVAEVERDGQQHPNWVAAMETDIEIRRICDDLISGGPPGEETGIPNLRALETIRQYVTSAAPFQTETESTHSRHHLSDCLKSWTDWMTNDGATPKTANIKQNEKRFKAFTRCIGNLPVSSISYNDFLKWQKWVKKQSAKWSSVKTGKDHHATVHKILAFAKRKNKTWDFPTGLLEWANDWKDDREGKTPYVPKTSNAEPMPVDVYRRCLAAADQWASIDPNQYDSKTQKGRGQRRQAKIKQREGVQFAALLRLAIHGLDTVDCTRIAWHNIVDIDGALPYYNFPRTKMKHRTGYAIERKTPLLPDCVVALKRWRDFEKPGRTIFKTAQGTRYNSSTLGNAFKKLRGETDEQWTLKHLRNVGGTLADQNGMSEMMVDRFLGHTLKKARAKYLGSVGPEYLSGLVNLIDERYFPD